MNARQWYQHLIGQGYTPTEAEDMVEEEREFERRAAEEKLHEEFRESQRGELK